MLLCWENMGATKIFFSNIEALHFRLVIYLLLNPPGPFDFENKVDLGLFD
jgi:hypothetical protein